MVLRRRHGCFYSPQIANWLRSPSEATKVLSFSSLPEDTSLAVRSSMSLVGELDALMGDELLLGRIQAKAFQYRNPSSLTINETNEMAIFNQVFGGDYDTERIIEAYELMTPQDVKTVAERVFKGVCGLYVQGPQPDLVPSLEHLQEIVRSHTPEPEGLSRAFGARPPENHA